MRSRRMIVALATVSLLGLPARAQDGAGAPGESGLPQVKLTRQGKPAKQKPAPIYDESADATEQIAAALAKAKKENRRVLIQWGANWCGWCHLLHDTFKQNSDVRRKLSYEYDIVLIDIGKWDKNIELAAGYGADLKGNGVPYLTVLDADGAVLANRETGSLEAKTKGTPGHDPQMVLAFLTEHQAPYLTAESVMSDALKQAREEDKKVFLHFGAPWCVWCKKLEAWLDREEVHEIWSRDFVDLKIDNDRMIGGKDLYERFTEGKPSGIPWFAFLDADGDVIANSFYGADQQNLGCPYSPEEIAAFREILSDVTKRIDADEIAQITALMGKQKTATDETTK